MVVAPLAPRPRVYIDYQADVRLRQLEKDLERNLFIVAAQAGDIVRRSTSSLEFPGAPSYKAASSGLEMLRNITREELGWHHGTHLGIPVTFNNRETVAIAVTEGDRNVGILANDDPKTVAFKGSNTTMASDSNRLFESPLAAFWYLLTYSSEDGLWIELSSPIDNSGGRPRGWDERILIGEIREKGSIARADRPLSPPSEKAVVNVHRKQA